MIEKTQNHASDNKKSNSYQLKNNNNKNKKNESKQVDHIMNEFHDLMEELEHINKVGVLRNSDVKLELVQNSDYFNMSDAMDGVIALGWEIEEYDENNRLVFKFGEEEESVKNKLYEKDLILEFEKKVVYEN